MKEDKVKEDKVKEDKVKEDKRTKMKVVLFDCAPILGKEDDDAAMIIDAAATVDAAAMIGAGCMGRRGDLGVEADDEGGRTLAPRRRAR